MRLRSLLLNAVITGAAAATLAVPSVAVAQPSAGQAIRVAVANTARILNDLQETKDLNQKMQNDLRTLDTERATREQKVKDLQAARDALKPDSPQFVEKNKEWLQARIEYEIWVNLQKANLEREQKVQMRQLFNKISQAVAEVATQRGIDLVFAEQFTEIPENLEAINAEQLKAVIGQRNILFKSTAVDITNDVITNLDAKYRSGG
jgi:Skp family chaperone for outer membrane proteins